MKKQLLPILLTLTVIILSSCDSASDIPALEDNPASEIDSATDDISSNELDPTKVNYFTVEALYRPYKNAQDLAEDADIVITGQVKDISFAVLDLTTGLPPTEKTLEQDRTLHTIYSIDVTESYKGNTADSIQFMVDCGVKDYRVEEQLKLVKEMNAWPEDCIPLHNGMPEIKIGETYLFTLRDSELRGFKGSLPTIKSPQRTFFNLINPLKKYGYDNPETGTEVITVKSIISYFGADKWDAFWSDWQKNNPNWESRLAEMEAEVDVPKQEEWVYEEQSGEGEILFAETEPKTFE